MAGANSFPHVLEATDLSDLSSVHVSELNFGALCWVDLVGAHFALTATPSIPPDGITVIAPVPQAAPGKPGAAWEKLSSGGGGSGTPLAIPNTIASRDAGAASAFGGLTSPTLQSATSNLALTAAAPNGVIDLFSGTQNMLRVETVGTALALLLGSTYGVFVLQPAQPPGLGTQVGGNFLISAQQGQNVLSGTNRDGGDLLLAGGNSGTGGTGGTAGKVEVQSVLYVTGPELRFAGQPTLTFNGGTDTFLTIDGSNNVTVGDPVLVNSLTMASPNDVTLESVAGNFAFISSASPGAGGGVGVIAIQDATTVPGSNPTGGGILYVEAGALKYRGPSGTVTPIAAA